MNKNNSKSQQKKSQIQNNSIQAVDRLVVVFVTAPSVREAKNIASAVLNKKLAACANMLNGVYSHYWWKGKIEHSREVLIIMKTRQNMFKRLAAEVKKNHSYEVPEIIALPIVAGSAYYLEWIDESLQ
jgi:periplasmic divalent cation tolerance protein